MFHNFLKFLKTRPPLFLFIICLVLFSIVLFVLDQYIKYNEVPNPDTRQDWNKVLESFSTLEFCLSSNKTHKNHYLKNEIPEKNILTYSMRITFKMQPAMSIMDSNYRLVNTFLNGKQLGMKGLYADDQVNVSFILPPITQKDVGCFFNKTCQFIDVKSCVVFRTRVPMFSTEIAPKKCPKDKILAIERSKSMLYLTWHRKETLFRYLSCSQQTSFKTEYKLNPGLTVMLTQAEVALVREHIYVCIYVLLIMISLFLMYGVTCGYRDLASDIPQYNT